MPFLSNYIYHLTLWPSLTNGTQVVCDSSSLPQEGKREREGEEERKGCHQMTQIELGMVGDSVGVGVNISVCDVSLGTKRLMRSTKSQACRSI